VWKLAIDREVVAQQKKKLKRKEHFALTTTITSKNEQLTIKEIGRSLIAVDSKTPKSDDVGMIVYISSLQQSGRSELHH